MSTLLLHKSLLLLGLHCYQIFHISLKYTPLFTTIYIYIYVVGIMVLPSQIGELMEDQILQFYWIGLNINHHHHHHHHPDVRLARISLTLSLHVFLSFIAFGRSSGLHPVSSHSCCMNVRAGRPAFDWPYAGVNRSTSLTISSLLL